MEQLIELLKQIQDLAGVAIDALEGASDDTKKEKPEGSKPEGEAGPEGGPPRESAPREGGEAPREEEPARAGRSY